MEQSKREELIAAIRGQPWTDNGPAPVVSLEEFFIGNDDLGSIGCNLPSHPGIQAFFERLRAIRERPDVQEVLVESYEVEEAENVVRGVCMSSRKPSPNS